MVETCPSISDLKRKAFEFAVKFPFVLTTVSISGHTASRPTHIRMSRLSEKLYYSRLNFGSLLRSLSPRRRLSELFLIL